MNTETDTNVLLVQAEPSLTQSMGSDLRTLGYQLTLAQSASSTLVQLRTAPPALIMVDRPQGTVGRFELCRQIRHSGSRVPLLLLLENDAVDDRVACLEAGADDYLLKPYQRETFLQRMRLYLGPKEPEAASVLRFGDLVLQLTNRSAIRGQRTIDLTMKEFELLKYLMEHPGEVLSRDDILDQVWGYDFMGESNVIEVYIRYLRLKLEAQQEKRLIHTVRGTGYVLRES